MHAWAKTLLIYRKQRDNTILWQSCTNKRRTQSLQMITAHDSTNYIILFFCRYSYRMLAHIILFMGNYMSHNKFKY